MVTIAHRKVLENIPALTPQHFILLCGDLATCSSVYFQERFDEVMVCSKRGDSPVASE